ncbi:MAG: hypothetical protein JW788_05990 [Candidatus Omnitrophica bacterium]|nr:hypothetical protein [Candidatus Omnitrophota bacterium]
MSIRRCMSLLSLITFLSLFYVWQQTEILRLAYEGQKKSALLERLTDKNIFLSYNIKKNTSLVRLGNKISEGHDFQIPESYRMLSLTRDSQNAAQKHSPGRENLFARIFSIKREAEARTLERQAK